MKQIKRISVNRTGIQKSGHYQAVSSSPAPRDARREPIDQAGRHGQMRIADNPPLGCVHCGAGFAADTLPLVGRFMASVTLNAVRLTKRYGARTALHELDFTANEGEVVGLLGPNGAGKTTTIRLLTTVLTRRAATSSWLDGPRPRWPKSGDGLGCFPKATATPVIETGREYLRYYARLYGISRSLTRGVADRLLADVGLDERATSPISSYSRGMRRRLGIARALVNNPAVVFLDEPTLGLDPLGKVQVLSIVRNLAERSGATIVLSTHALPEVEDVCSKVLILDRGRVRASGSVAEVIRSAMVDRSAQLRVAVELVEPARRAIAAIPGFGVDQPEGRPGMLRIALPDHRVVDRLSPPL